MRAMPGVVKAGMLMGRRSVRLVFTAWLPEGEPAAAVVLVHGYGEHRGRYRHVAEALVREGYAVYAADHLGHGESEGERAMVRRFDDFADDLHLVVGEARRAHQGLPVFVVGHSMGGLISLRYALRYQDELAGLVVSGAALYFGEDVSPWLRAVAGLLARFAPKYPVVRRGTGGESVLSRDPAVQALFDADPLCYKGPVLARFGHELDRAARLTRPRLGELTLPLLVMHGEADTFVNPKGSVELYQQARSADKTLKLWSGCRHEIFNELEKDEVIAALLSWLGQRTHSGSESRIARHEERGPASPRSS
jgi:acylglycerol lipase